MKINRLIIIFIVIINFGCKVSKKQSLSHKKIIKGEVIFEEFEEQSSVKKKANLKALKQLTKFDSILKLNEKTINEIRSSEDSLAVYFFNKNFDSNGYVKDEFFLASATDTSIVKLIIQPKKIFIPSSTKNLKGETDFYKFGKVINRDCLYRCFGQIQKKCRKERQVNFQNEEDYDVIYFKNKRKRINGYDCFLVRCYSKKGFYHYDLYVTSDIHLNYNYLFNLKSLTDNGYLILEKTLYTQLSTRTTRLRNIELSFTEN